MYYRGGGLRGQNAQRNKDRFTQKFEAVARSTATCSAVRSSSQRQRQRILCLSGIDDLCNGIRLEDEALSCGPAANTWELPKTEKLETLAHNSCKF